MPLPAAVMVKRGTNASVAWSVVLIIVGLVGIAAPFAAAFAIGTLVACFLIVGGIVRLLLAFHARGTSGVLWELFVGLLYVAIGGWMVVHPILLVASLTLLVGVFFIVEGLFETMVWHNVRGSRGAWWLLLDGLITILLALMIWAGWPSSAVWVIGTLVGVSILLSGIARLMLSLAVRRAAGA
jgi:uncharacterized membrane protein HdeD (DUF308 family)